MIKLVVSDIDGTLIFDQEKINVLSQRIIPLIKKCLEHNIYFAVASGRSYSNLKKIFLPVWEDIYFLAENGNVTFYKDKILRNMSIPKPIVKDLVHHIENMPNLGACFTTASKLLTFEEPRDFSDMLVYQVKNAVQIIDNVEQVYAEDIANISAYTPMDALEEANKEYQEKWGDLLRVTKSGGGWIDFALSGKGAGVRALMHTLGIPKDKAMVFGDNYNDIEMFDATKYSFAMENADDTVKAKANYVTDSVEDVIEKYLNEGIL